RGPGGWVPVREEGEDAGIRLVGQIDDGGIGPARVRPAVLVVRLRVDDPDPALGDRKERVDPLNAPGRRAESKPADLARVPRVGDVEDDRAADAVGQVGTVAHDVRGTVEVVAL